MSLINDALRKARQAASERTTAESDAPFRGKRLHPVRQSRSGSRLAVVVLVAAVAAVAGASAAWWAAGRQAKRDEFPGTQQAAVAAGEQPGNVSQAPATADLRDDPETETASPGAGTATAAVQSPATQTAPSVNPQQPAAQEPTDSSPTAASQAASPPPAAHPAGHGAQPSPPRTGAGGDRVFVLEADLGYAKLSLDYIVFRPDDPFAEINGIEVHEGWFVDDFVVDTIERDRVILHDEKGPLILRVP